MDIKDILALGVENNASDIHLRVGKVPWFRINGSLAVLDGPTEVTRLDIETFMRDAYPAYNPSGKFDSDFLVKASITGNNRFRANLFHSEGQPGLVMRSLPAEIPQLSTIGLPHHLIELLSKDSGLILVTGATGSGKSTTLASMIQHICCQPHQHVITIEDPIEFHLSAEHNLITQRELKSDVESFPIALKSAMREDPDIIMVGETRDRETADLVLTAAETGHLVFSTLHTSSAIGTANRLINMFPPEDKNSVGTRLADSLLAVVSQTLLPKLGGGRVMAYELLIANNAIRNNLRSGNIIGMASTMQSGKRESGMVSMEDCLDRLQAEKLISRETYTSAQAKFAGSALGR